MKNSTKLLMAVAAVALVAAAQPAMAACGNAYLINAPGKQVFSNPAACDTSAGYCYTQSAYPGVAPVSAGFEAVFWSMGTGNPAQGAGDDNGAFDDTQWVEQYFFPSIGYYRAVSIQNPGGSTANWSQAGDGCIDNQGTDGSQCTCIGMFDEWNSVGYFALLSKQADNGNFDFSGLIPGNLDLAPVPAPTIVSSTRNGNNVDLTVTVTPPSSGLYLDPACGPCANIGYEIYEAIVPRGAASPADRDASWSLVSSGAAPVGDTTQVSSACGDSQQDVWLTSRLVVDSGFETFYVSGDTLRVECGPNLADPVDLDARPRPTRPKGKPQISRPSRGR